VLATLHTNDAASAVTRLTDMGIEPFLLSSSLLGVLAQRLVRKLCPHCKAPAQDEAGRPNGQYVPVGCEHCGHTGYAGRTGVFELLVVDEALRALIHQRAPEADLHATAQRTGLVPMRADGERLVRLGLTSPQELVRVTRD
jgi:general secretion pathway protein E